MDSPSDRIGRQRAPWWNGPVLGGKQVVFLSCTGALSAVERLARPIRDRLNALGYHAVIVGLEPSFRGDFSPEEKVDGYLDASDAFIALATLDDRLGTSSTAANIIDEIGRARRMPSLRDVVCVMKQPDVNLPSNISPVYESLDLDDPDATYEFIVRQLETWNVVPTVPPAPPPAITALPDNYLDELLDGNLLGAHDEINARVRKLFGALSKQDQHRVAHHIFDSLLSLPDDGTEIHVAGDVLVACAHIDPALIEDGWIEQLAESRIFQHRTAAALLLWDQAVVNPGIVPLDCVAKLAKPSTEDWYVYAPAIAAAKQLALTRLNGLGILLDLSDSPDATDRDYAVSALTEIADVDPAIVWGFARRHLEQVAHDPDEGIARRAFELLARLRELDPDVRHTYGHFGL